jgi:hypothetical protein
MTTSISLAELEDAVQYMAHFSGSVILLDLSTGNCVYDTKDTDTSQMLNIPDPVTGETSRQRYIPVPDKYQLNIGRSLVLSFCREHFADDYHEIFHRFKHANAYKWWRIFLDKHGAIQIWQEYRNRRTKEALIKWCDEQQIEYFDDFAGGGKKDSAELVEPDDSGN